jgi:hypothetical protein
MAMRICSTILSSSDPDHRTGRRDHPIRVDPRGAGMLAEFKRFLFRGNVIDLAVLSTPRGV